MGFFCASIASICLWLETSPGFGLALFFSLAAISWRE